MRKIVTEPTVEPITTAEAKLYLKVDISDEDALIAELIKAARIMAENYTGRQLVTATWELYLDEFPEVIELYRCPVGSVTSIKYYDSDNVLQTLSTDYYTVDAVSQPARIAEAPDYAWPSTEDRVNAVIVKYDAGYGLAASVPEPFKVAIKLTVGHLYETRQDVTKDKMHELPLGAKHILNFYRVY